MNGESHSPEYLTQREFAWELRQRGIAISVDRVRHLRYLGKIQAVRFGHRSIRIHRSEVEKFIGRAKRAS